MTPAFHLLRIHLPAGGTSTEVDRLARRLSSHQVKRVEEAAFRPLRTFPSAVGTPRLLNRLDAMKIKDANEFRAQAKHCRELAMSTKDAEIEQLFLQTAEDLEGQASRLEVLEPGNSR